MKTAASLGVLFAALMLATGAQASIVNISGVPFGTDGTVAFAGYGTAQSNNNVVTYAPSHTSDPSGGAYWYVEGSTTTSEVTTDLSAYGVNWYFIGAESGYTITFVGGAPVDPVTHTEANENNNCCYSSPTINPLNPIGTSSGLTSSIIPIDFFINGALTPAVSNGTNDPATLGQALATIMFGYVQPQYSSGVLTGWTVVNTPTSWFAFGLDDGGVDDNHDDWMGIGHVYSEVPIPAALPLFGTALAGLGWASRRKRGSRPSV